MLFWILLQIKALNQPKEETHQRTSTQTHLRVQMSQLKLQLMTHIFMFSLMNSTMAKGSTQRIATFCSYTHNIIMLTVASKPKLWQSRLTIIEWSLHLLFMAQLYQLDNKLYCLIQSNSGVFSPPQNLEMRMARNTFTLKSLKLIIQHLMSMLIKTLTPTVST